MPVGFQAGLRLVDWVLSGASVDLDLANNRYFGSSGGLVSSYLSISRASIGYAKTSGGVLTQFSSGQLRRTDLGLLIEEARTNLELGSQTFAGGTYWTAPAGIGVTDNATTAPDGTSTAARLYENTTSSQDFQVNQDQPGSTLATGTYTFSCYCKAGARNWVKLCSPDAGGNLGAWFNLATGVVGTVDSGQSASIEACANGWYRCVVTLTTVSTTQRVCHVFICAADGATTHTGIVGNDIFVWGAQLELGAFASSYIPTTGTSATRAADAVTCIGSLATILTSSAGSAVMDVKLNAVPTNYWRLLGSDTSVGGSNYAEFLGSDNASNTAVISYMLAVILSTPLGGGLKFTDGVKVATGWNSSGRSIVGGGGTVASDANTLSMSPNIKVFSGDPTGDFKSFGYVRRLAAWISRLADATLQALTT
jgi:hypothetical protein